MKTVRCMALAVALIAQASLFAATKPDTTSPLLSVGYASVLPASGSVRLSSAPHASLTGSARITIRGGARADKYLKSPGGIALDAVFANGRTVFFWTATRFTTAPNATIVAPSLIVRDLGAKTEGPVTLARGGVYVIAIRESASDAAPDWNRLELVRQGGRYVVPNIGVGYAVITVE